MKYFLDCEFIEYPGVVDLISIGLVSDDDRTYYAINKDCNFSKANEWVRNNVLAALPPYNPLPNQVSPRVWEESRAWKSREDIMLDVAYFMKCRFDYTYYLRHGLAGWWDRFCLNLGVDCGRGKYSFQLREDVEPPEIYGEYSSYDFVCFAQLFGALVNIPSGFPYRCRDIIQLAEDELGIPASELPSSLEIEGNHNALLGAKTVKMRYEWLMEQKRTRARLNSAPSQN